MAPDEESKSFTGRGTSMGMLSASLHMGKGTSACLWLDRMDGKN